jgi:hypothetical protein
MKARVKSTGEVVEVRPERDGFFIDEENNNVYKFDELDFTYKEENPFQDPFASMLSGFLNPTKDLQKDFKEQFNIKLFVEVFFDFFELMQQSYDYPDRAFDESLRYTKKLMNEIKKVK